mgnify:CR=1 FL=1
MSQQPRTMPLIRLLARQLVEEHERERNQQNQAKVAPTPNPTQNATHARRDLRTLQHR